MSRLAHLWNAAVRFFAQQSELQERLALLNRPWEEDFLHWVDHDGDCRLHGHLPPPRTRRRLSVTRGGWCPGLQHDNRTDAERPSSGPSVPAP